MRTRNQNIPFLWFNLLFMTVAGSIVTLHQSDDAFQPGLTKTMTMRCAFNDTVTSSSGSLIGRSVSHTDTDIQFITSLSLSRNSKDVAMVTEHVAAHALSDHSNIRVDGQITGTSGELGYLQITWTYPTIQQEGEYTCEVSALDDGGHTVVFSTSAAVETSTPTISDLVSYIHDLEVKTQQQDLNINDTRGTVQQLEAKLKDQESQLIESRHVETGLIQCGQSSTWGGHSKQVTQRFQKAYQAPPVVYLSVYTVDAVTTVTYLYYKVDLKSVDVNGFVSECWCMLEQQHAAMYHFDVKWISFPQ